MTLGTEVERGDDVGGGAGPRHLIELFRDKQAAGEALRRSGLEWPIVRPYGQSLDVR